MYRALLALSCFAVLAPAQTLRDTAWRQDLTILSTNLPKLHPNLFYYSPQSAFDAAVAGLWDDIPSLPDSDVAIRLAEIVALAHDGHTNLMLTQRSSMFRMLPLSFQWFTDGLWVTGASPAYARAAGARVVRIGDRSAEEAHQAVKRIVSHENDIWVREMGATYLANADVLRALGIAPSSQTVRLELAGRNGETFTLDVASKAPGEPSGIAAHPDPATGFVPLYQRNRSRYYWFTYLESARTLYFAYNQCQEMPDLSMAQLAADFWTTFDSRPVERIVVDLRLNTGGNSAVIAPFLEGGLARTARLATVRTAVIIGRRTYSSGIRAAVTMHVEGTVLYGEPSGGSPNSYGEVLNLTLPNSRLLVSYSTQYKSYPSLPPGPLLPDVQLPYHSADYFARHDPFLAAALADAVPLPEPAGGPIAVVNGASLRGPVAPGGIAAALGDFDSDRVEVDGVAAVVLGAAGGRVAFQVPPEIRPGLLPIRVGQTQGAIRVVETAPGLFTATARDGLVEIDGTGLGNAEARIYIGAELAPIVSSAPNPAMPGLWRWTAIAPPSAGAGQLPVFLTAAGAASNGVTVPVGR